MPTPAQSSPIRRTSPPGRIAATCSCALNRLEEGVAAYRRVLELKPGDASAYDALTRALYRAGKIDQAIAVYQEWLQADPGNSIAQHMLAACTGAAAPPRASDNYVRDTFDAFAGSFDQVLDQLGYRAPGLIGELLDRELPAADGSLTIADAGCGTGLCADFLRPRAKRLIGSRPLPGHACPGARPRQVRRSRRSRTLGLARSAGTRHTT